MPCAIPAAPWNLGRSHPPLLGFRFAPRLRDLKDRRLYAFRGQAVPDVLTGMVGGTVDADHVRAHWDEALRLTVSVGAGQASASGMLRRLAAARTAVAAGSVSSGSVLTNRTQGALSCPDLL